jgi:hypothetical protein
MSPRLMLKVEVKIKLYLSYEYEGGKNLITYMIRFYGYEITFVRIHRKSKFRDTLQKPLP